MIKAIKAIASHLQFLYSTLGRQGNRHQSTIHKRMNTLYLSEILFMKTSGLQGLALRDMHCYPVIWMKSAVLAMGVELTHVHILL